MSTIMQKHHIIPRYMGGTNCESNLIKLTIQEHAAWHYELWVYYGKIEDWIAWKCLLGQGNDPDVWLAKTKLGGLTTGKLGKCGNRKGVVLSDKQKVQISIKMKGRKISDETKQKMSLAAIGKPKSEIMKQKLRSFRLGTKQTPETIAKTIHPKTWQIRSPDGEEKVIVNLRLFCRENNLTPCLMIAVAQGKQQHHKGWSCKYL